MAFSLLFLAFLTLTCLPLSQSYRDGARFESCYNMLVAHYDTSSGQIEPPMDCGSPCHYQLSVVGRVDAENNLDLMESNSTTYLCGEIYQCEYKMCQMSLFLF